MDHQVSQIAQSVEHRSTNLRSLGSIPTLVNEMFNLSLSVCDEQFFARIYIYHSDEVILQLLENYWLARMKASDRGRPMKEEAVHGC